jgi:hypothetical protein
MTSHEAALVAELLASDAIEELYVKLREVALEQGATSLPMFLICHLIVEEIEEAIAPADRIAIKEMVAATSTPGTISIGEAANKVVRSLSNDN